MPIDESLRNQFEQCIDRNSDSLYRVAFRLTGNADLATELVQETFLNAWNNLDSIRDQSKVRSWMFSILRNQYSKLVRKDNKVKFVSTDQATDLECHLNDFVANQKSNTNSNQEIIQSALSQLDDLHRMPLLLVSMESMTVDEAASVLEIPRGTVLSRLYRARAKLRKILECEFKKIGQPLNKT